MICTKKSEIKDNKEATSKQNLNQINKSHEEINLIQCWEQIKQNARQKNKYLITRT